MRTKFIKKQVRKTYLTKLHTVLKFNIKNRALFNGFARRNKQ